MATMNWDTFERYRQKGLDARRAGQWDSARIYLLEAARAMLELSKQAQGDELRDGRREMSKCVSPLGPQRSRCQTEVTTVKTMDQRYQQTNGIAS